MRGIDTAAAAFHFQQAAEKALKAALLSAGAEFPRTHDLSALWDRLADLGVLPQPDTELRARLNRLSLLNVVGRYPVMDETVAPSDWILEPDVRAAEETVAEVFAAVSGILDPGGAVCAAPFGEAAEPKP